MDNLDGRIITVQRAVLGLMLRLINDKSQPNINELWSATKDLDVLKLNVKNFGFELARRLMPALESVVYNDEPRNHNLVSKATTQTDMLSPWFSYWCDQLKIAPLFHRKLWEFAFVLQVLFERGMLVDGKRGLGFGCGEEPMASYFANKGLDVTITDLPPHSAVGTGWLETGQHTSTIDKAWQANLVSREKFDEKVSLRFVDMNAISDDLIDYDFCWSICAMEHLGSIRKGLDFVLNSLACLRPGGIAIHTTEFNFSRPETIDNWPTVLFRKSDFESLASELRAQGHTVLGVDYDVGSDPLDRFIDVPPYSWDQGDALLKMMGGGCLQAHLKLSVDGFPSTCLGIVVIKSH